MNWLTNFLSNPNLHVFIGTVVSGLSLAFPQYAAPLVAIGSLFGGIGILVPEKPSQAVIGNPPISIDPKPFPVPVPVPQPFPAPEPAPVGSPAPIAPFVLPVTGSLHLADYIQIGVAVANALRPNNPIALPPLPTSGSLHSNDYINIVTAVMAIMKPSRA